MEKNIQYKNRKTGELIDESPSGEGLIKFLYQTSIGKLPLHILFKRKLFSTLFGKLMDSPISRKGIDSFKQKYKMDLSDYIVPEAGFRTFNEFFYRRVKPESRKIENDIVSPADGKVLAFQSIQDVHSFFIKGRQFTLSEYFINEDLAKRYEDGAMIIIRLAPTDYHRFHFPVDGIPGVSKLVKGYLYSVSPYALNKSLEIFCENKRTLCEIETNNYGNILYSEVGATNVGSIIQTYTPNKPIKKGDEKGCFAFGGSTVVLFFEKSKVKIAEDLLTNTKSGIETEVQMGETIAS